MKPKARKKQIAWDRHLDALRELPASEICARLKCTRQQVFRARQVRGIIPLVKPKGGRPKWGDAQIKG